MGYRNIAVIGSGPSGIYAAQALVKADDQVHVTILEKYPFPYGLVRFGVAPDHPKIKTVALALEKVLNHERIEFLGNIDIGKDVTVQELKEQFDAVVVATGCQQARQLGVEGESGKHCYDSLKLVYWYNGHPDYTSEEINFKSGRVFIIGQGNVALDLLRMLVLDREKLAQTDISSHALEILKTVDVSEVVLVGRRGLEKNSFSLLELKELHSLENCGFEIWGEQDWSKILEDCQEDKAKEKSCNEIKNLCENGPKGEKKIVFWNNAYVNQIKEGDSENEIIFKDHQGQEYPHKASALIKSIGYRLEPLAEIDQVSGNHYQNQLGKIEDRLYVVGWAKRGSSGVIGTNKKCSADTIKKLIEDSEQEGWEPKNFELEEWKKGLGKELFTFEDWIKIDQWEREQGDKKGKPREKVVSVQEALEILGR